MENAGLLPTDTKRLREIEDENSPLQKVIADLALDKEKLIRGVTESGSGLAYEIHAELISNQ